MFLSCHVRVSEWIYQMSFSHHQKSSNVFQSLSSLTMSRIFSSATAVAVHFGWNSSAFMFTLFSLTSLVVLFDSHCYYNGYKNCINEFLTSSLSNRPDHIVFMPFIIDLSCSFFESEITSSLRAQKKNLNQRFPCCFFTLIQESTSVFSSNFHYRILEHFLLSWHFFQKSLNSV